MNDAGRRFREAYAAHRAAEGRGAGGASEVRALPYLTRGPTAAQWRVRARTYERFLSAVVGPRERQGRTLTVLDLGAGNGWLSHRLGARGHRALALDARVDAVDGLGASHGLWCPRDPWVVPVAAEFEAIPLAEESVDLTIFNASLHYAFVLCQVLAEARRVTRSGGAIAILDTPFYPRDADGAAMVAEKARTARERFGDAAETLAALPFIEYLTAERLDAASRGLGVAWRRHRVRYPLTYELRPLLARVRGRRRPSRFDLWEGVVS